MFRYTVYADKQGGGYYCWFYNYKGDKITKHVFEKSNVLTFAKNYLDGYDYKIVWVK